MPLSIPHEVALYQLSAFMKDQVTVALSGEGADELFGGYGRVQRSPFDWKKVAVAQSLLGSKMSAIIATRPPLGKEAFAQLACEDHLQHFFQAYNWMPFTEKWDLMTDDALSTIDRDARTIEFFRKLFSSMERTDPYDRLLHVFERVHLSCLLERLDAVSMAVGVEARVPFVDHELVTFVTNMPFKYKIRWNSPLALFRALFHASSEISEWLDTTKYLLRRVGADLLPREIANRKKLGFPTPLDRWMESGLRQLAHDLLLNPRSRARGIFDPLKLKRFLDQGQSLPFDFNGKKVWMLVNIEMWMRERDRWACGRPVSPSIAHVAQQTQSGGRD